MRDVPRQYVFLLSHAKQSCAVEDGGRLWSKTFERLGEMSNTHALGGTWADLRSLWKNTHPSTTVVMSLPLVGWKKRLITPLMALCICWIKGADRVLIVHEWADLATARRITYLFYCFFASSLLFSSPYVQKQYENDSWTGLSRNSIKGVVPMPPMLRRPAQFVDTPLAAQIRTWKAEGRYVLAVFGSIYPKKQTTRALNVAIQLKKHGLNPMVLFIGSFIRGSEPIEEMFWSNVRELHLSHDVTVSGYVASEPEVFGLFAEVDAFAYMFTEGLTSRRGSVLACLQSGKPVVVNAPYHDSEFAFHPTYQRLLAAQNLRLVPHAATVDDYADALMAARGQPISNTVIDFDACWAEAASVFMNHTRPHFSFAHMRHDG